MATIQIKTAIPGPRSQEWMKRREKAVPRAAYHMTPIFVARAEGAVLEDVDGNQYIDFAGGLGCLNVGHRAPKVIAGLRAQLDRYLHTSLALALARSSGVCAALRSPANMTGLSSSSCFIYAKNAGSHCSWRSERRERSGLELGV